jgi:hypothetical protein
VSYHRVAIAVQRSMSTIRYGSSQPSGGDETVLAPGAAELGPSSGLFGEHPH